MVGSGAQVEDVDVSSIDGLLAVGDLAHVRGLALLAEVKQTWLVLLGSDVTEARLETALQGPENQSIKSGPCYPSIRPQPLLVEDYL